MTASTAPQATRADRAGWDAAHVRPLWEIAQAHNDATTVPRIAHWPWRVMRPLVDRACDLATPAVAERRVLSMIAPDARPDEFHTITNLNGGLQILLPGERARPHRHAMDALRFVLEGGGAVTRVDGKEAPMEWGDLVLTPGWCWHEHWHDGNAPVIWLDVLDVHAHLHLGTFAFEPGPPHDVPALPPDEAFAQANVVPELVSPAHSPVFRYPLADVRRALDATPPASDGSRRVRYVNPLTGGPVMSLLDCTMLRLAPGCRTHALTTSAHALCAVVTGRGTSSAGPAAIRWETNDVFALPAHAPIVHHADEPADLFICSDREIYRRLDLLTEIREGAR
jgi:gentisate 1,2-dioxygenase